MWRPGPGRGGDPGEWGRSNRLLHRQSQGIGRKVGKAGAVSADPAAALTRELPDHQPREAAPPWARAHSPDSAATARPCASDACRSARPADSRGGASWGRGLWGRLRGGQRAAGASGRQSAQTGRCPRRLGRTKLPTDVLGSEFAGDRRTVERAQTVTSHRVAGPACPSVATVTGQRAQPILP